MASNVSDARAILKEARQELMAKPNVVATGVGYKISGGKKTDQISLVCSVDTKKSKQSLSASELIPSEVQSIPTDVYPSGLIYALQEPTGRFRPAPGGVSIGHFNITAGTLGCLVKKNNKLYILSNNHVLANSNDASNGDAILQPGPHDGGNNPQDRIASLTEFVPIEFEGGDDGGGTPSPCPISNFVSGVLNGAAALLGSQTRLMPVRPSASTNLVDAALAEPVEEDVIVNEILGLGQISGIAEGELEMAVKKSGRTTGITNDNIIQIDVTAQVGYGGNKVALFVDQLMAGAMSAGGDSGSAVLSEDNKLVGLLFAGSNTTTIINRIQNVFNAFQVTLP